MKIERIQAVATSIFTAEPGLYHIFVGSSQSYAVPPQPFARNVCLGNGRARSLRPKVFEKAFTLQRLDVLIIEISDWLDFPGRRAGD